MCGSDDCDFFRKPACCFGFSLVTSPDVAANVVAAAAAASNGASAVDWFDVLSLDCEDLRSADV